MRVPVRFELRGTHFVPKVERKCTTLTTSADETPLARSFQNGAGASLTLIGAVIGALAMLGLLPGEWCASCR